MSYLEDDFWKQSQYARIVLPECEYRFHPERRWRFDFAWPFYQIALEIEGGTWVSGRHSRGAGMRADCEKYNAAVLAGWKVLRVTSDMVKDGSALNLVEQALQTFAVELDRRDECPAHHGSQCCNHPEVCKEAMRRGPL